MSNDKEFWTDELVREFAALVLNKGSVGGYKAIDDFKKSKEPKKDYEILVVKNHFDNNGKQSSQEIETVRRLSDGEKFSVGDEVNYGTIEAFKEYPLKHGSYIDVHFKERCGCSLASVQHKKTPLFTTEDGKEILEGDEIWFVRLRETSDHSAWSIDYAIVHADISEKGYKIFSTEDKAKEYVLLNKPCLSCKDILHLWCLETDTRKALRELAQRKLNQ